MKQQSMLERVAASFADRIHQEMNDPYESMYTLLDGIGNLKDVTFENGNLLLKVDREGKDFILTLKPVSWEKAK